MNRTNRTLALLSASAFALSPMSLPIANADIISNLVGHWTFDNNANDSAGVANNGTLLNGAAITTTAGDWMIGGGALALDGIDDHVSVADHPELDGNGSGGLTLSAFIKGTGWPASNNILAKNNNSQYRFRIQGSGNTIWYLHSDGSLEVDQVSGIALNLDQWYHVAVTSDNVNGGFVRFYVDGALVGTPQLIDSTTGIQDTAGPLRIGSYTGTSENFQGFIDDVRIYNRVLSAGDIAQLSVIPEPATGLLVVLGGLVLMRRRLR